MGSYYLHGLTVECSYPLSGSPAGGPAPNRGSAFIDTRQGAPPSLAAWLQHHRLDSGAIWLSKGRAQNESGWLVAIRDIACFHLEPDRETVHCHAAAGASPRDISYVTENQLVPVLAALQGYSLVHASGVSIGNRAALFLGPTGRGKSTLALSFALSGEGRLLTDDCATFAQGAGTSLLEPPSLLPSGAAPRLWPDSFEGLFGTAERGHRGSDYSQKLAAPWSFTNQGRDPDPIPLSSLFVLEDPLEGGSEAVQIEKASAVEASLALVRNGIVFDPGDHEAASLQFRKVTYIATNIPAYRLRYRRGFDTLPAVRSAIVRTL